MKAGSRPDIAGILVITVLAANSCAVAALIYCTR